MARHPSTGPQYLSLAPLPPVSTDWECSLCHPGPGRTCKVQAVYTWEESPTVLFHLSDDVSLTWTQVLTDASVIKPRPVVVRFFASLTKYLRETVYIEVYLLFVYLFFLHVSHWLAVSTVFSTV